MRRWDRALLAILAILASQALAQAPAPFSLVQILPLPGVEGRIDHMAVDLKNQRLFVAALGNNSLEILDLASAKRIRSINGLSEPQGVAFLPGYRKLLVANGGDGSCQIFDGDSFRLLSKVNFSGDADNIRLDPTSRLVYVGYGKGALGILDPKNDQSQGDIKLAGHPESFQLERSGQRIYVNVPTARCIEVVDRTQKTVIATWPLSHFRSNFPMALDEDHHHVLVGTRQPPRVLVWDTTSGQMVDALKCGEDADDIFYDAERRLILVSCGEGLVDVFKQDSPGHFQELTRIGTAPGARTSLWVPDLKRLFVAVPHRGKQEAAIWVFEAPSD